MLIVRGNYIKIKRRIKMTKKRCHWVTKEPLYIEYHDKEWGRATFDKRALFELLCLEGQQAGLSWWTILQRRENYREAFDFFDPYLIAEYDEKDIKSLIENEGLIRNRLKLESIVKNARAYIKLEEKGISFTDYIWDFVGGSPLVNDPQRPEDIPTQTATSQKMSKQMKKDGFSFIGPVSGYAFMQASGMVDDHLTSCFLRE